MSVVLPESINTLENGTFLRCWDLTEIHLPESLTSIKDGVFWECHSLESINLPANIKTIGENAFLGCDNLRKIYCKPTTPPSIERYTFDHDIDNRKIYVPSNSVNAYKTAKVWAIFDDEITGYNF